MIFIRNRLFYFFLLAIALIPAWSGAEAGSQAASQTKGSGWLYRDSDITPDPAWKFGALANGVRYAIRENALPAKQVSIRVRIDAGSLHEQDDERGWAHFVEHMAFRANKAFADREARHLLEKLGVSFGGDNNATTTPTQTAYQLDLPDADPEKIDTGLHYMSEMLDSALFDSAAVETERKIVLAEKERRPELSDKIWKASWPLFYSGLKIAKRDPIGAEAALQGASPAGLRAFYERWYRPERATVIVVGDADPAVMENLIARHFGDWQGEGPPPQEPDYGSIATPAKSFVPLVYPDAPYSITIIWTRPYEKLPDTIAREKHEMALMLAEQIINRRMEAKARGKAAFINAGINAQRQTNVASITGLYISPRDGKWQKALEESFAIISDAMRAPPSQAEIMRELANLRSVAVSVLEGENTIKSQQYAQQLVAAIDNDEVVSTATTTLAMIDEFSPLMTPEYVGAAMRSLFEGEKPRMTLLSPKPIPADRIGAAFASAIKAGPAKRLADRNVTFADLPPPGPEGKEASRQFIKDMNVTIVRFTNGSSLTFKRTDFEKGSVNVSLRFGNGVADLAPDRLSLHTLGAIIGASGIANLDLDAMERLLTGRDISMSFGVAENGLVVRGDTNSADLADQLRLFAAKIAWPRWDEPLFERTKAKMLVNYNLVFASASARSGREFAGFAHRGDKRWVPMEKQTLRALNLTSLQRFFDPLLTAGLIEVIIVGDTDLETAVTAMKKTIAALPPRMPVDAPAASRQVQAPAPSPEPVIFTHQGDPKQASAIIGWTTFGGTDRIRERRALSLAANILQTRLFEELREQEGASYAPSAAAISSQNFLDWGILYATSELRPENIDTFFRVTRKIVADLAARPISEEEFERAQNPIKSGIERRIKTNAYWLDALADWTNEPQLIEDTRNYLADYNNLTPQDVRAAVAAYVADEGDWSMLVLPAKAKDDVD